MSFLTDLIVPPWAKWIGVSLAVGATFVAGLKTGIWLQENKDAIVIAGLKTDLAEFKSKVSIEAAKQSQKAVQIALKQAKTNQEIVNDSTTRARALDNRLAAIGLRITAPCYTCRLSSITDNPGQSTNIPSQSLPAESERDTREVQIRVEQALQDATRDALQLTELIDAAHRVGCAGD